MANISIIDGDHICYIAAHIKKEDQDKYPNGKPVSVITESVDSYMKNILESTNADKYIGCLTIGKCFRYSIFPEYKANRTNKVPMQYIGLVKEYLKDKYKFIYHKNYESDDLCISLRRVLSTPDNNVVLISPDKDLLNTRGMNYDPKNQVFKPTTEDEENLAFYTQMVVGDSSDGIKGLPGKGEKYAEKVLYVDGIGNRSLVLEEYCNHFGEYQGVQEFHKHFMCLKMVDTIDVSEYITNNLIDLKPVEEKFDF